MTELLTSIPAPTPLRRAAADVCPGCGVSSPRRLLDVPSMPAVCNILWATAEAARRAPSASMRLSICEACGLVFNSAFDPQVLTYDDAYENSLHQSSRFQEYALNLARYLAEVQPMRGRLAVEIGAGKGEFLRLLCRETGARGIGIDASYDPALWPDAVDDDVQFVREPFSSLPDGLEPALVFCRHVLEHIAEPRAFVREMVRAARRSPDAMVFVEVPNVLYTLRDLGIWDLIYEHCLYFSAPALASLFEREGLRVTRTTSVYGGQYLCVEGRVDTGVVPPDRREEIQSIVRMGDALADHYRGTIAAWSDRLRQLAAAGKRVAVWGAGSKGISFVNMVPGAEQIDSLIDLNPRKRGRYVPRTAHPVIMPADAAMSPPDVILVMNPLYREEIAAQARQVGLTGTIELV